MPTARDKAIDRVRKLLAVAERDTTPANERTAMRRQAQRLITRHGIAHDETQSPPPQAPEGWAAVKVVHSWDEILLDIIDVVRADIHKKEQRRRQR